MQTPKIKITSKYIQKKYMKEEFITFQRNKSLSLLLKLFSVVLVTQIPEYGKELLRIRRIKIIYIKRIIYNIS
jgi:hypothetical protein